MYCANLDFTDPTDIHFDHPGNFTAAGDLAIGTGALSPSPEIAVGHLTGSGGIVISYSTPNINIDGTGAGSAITFNEDVGSATPAAGILNIIGAGTVSTSGAGNTITITGTGGGSSMTWNVIAASQTLAVNNGYFCTGGGVLSLLLPPVSVLGDTIEISIDGSAGYIVTQGAGQSIKFGDQITTVGVGGSITSLAQGDSIRMVCRVANLSWNILSSMGNLTFV